MAFCITTDKPGGAIRFGREEVVQAGNKKKADDAKKPTNKFTMQLQADTYSFNQDAANQVAFGDIQDGSAFRHARIGWLARFETNGSYGQLFV